MTEGKLARLIDDLKGEGFHVELFDGWVSHHFYGVEAAKAVRDHINTAADAWAEEKVRVAVLQERERCAKIAETLPTLHAWLPLSDGSDQNHHVTKHGIEIAAAIRVAPSQPEAKAGEASL